MARKSSRQLTALEVKRLGDMPGTHWVSRRLYLLVSTNLSASWIYRYQDDFRKHDHGLGPYPGVSLAEARDAVLECDRMRRSGIDPIEARRAQRLQRILDAAKAMTFRQCAAAFFQAHHHGWSNPKHARQWLKTLEVYVYPTIGDISVQAVDVSLIMRMLEPIWPDKTETASRVRGRIESVLDWATARGYRQGENPARWRGHLENLLPKRSKVQRVEHLAALPYREIGAFIPELRRQSAIAARALEFAILTVARTGEVCGALWSEVDLDTRIWTIPAERMKGRREHNVPLSDAAVAVLEEMARCRQGRFVFQGNRQRGLPDTAMLKMLVRMGRTDITVHGFRSTFSDWCSECTNFAGEVRKMALAHAVSDRVEAAYRRGDLFAKRRRLMEAWSAFCLTPAAVKSGTVVPLVVAPA